MAQKKGPSPFGCKGKIGIFTYMVFWLFQEKAYQNHDDLPLGHMIVLAQYDWPTYSSVFHQAINAIKQTGTFRYNLFFNYVISILHVKSVLLLLSLLSCTM